MDKIGPFVVRYFMGKHFAMFFIHAKGSYLSFYFNFLSRNAYRYADIVYIQGKSLTTCRLVEKSVSCILLLCSVTTLQTLICNLLQCTTIAVSSKRDNCDAQIVGYYIWWSQHNNTSPFVGCAVYSVPFLSVTFQPKQRTTVICPDSEGHNSADH